MGWLKSKWSRQCSQSYCPHLWTSWQYLGKSQRCICYNLFLVPTGRLKNWPRGKFSQDEGPNDPVEPLARLIDHLKKGQEFEIAGGRKLPIQWYCRKGSPFWRKIATFNKAIWEWHQESADINTWENSKTISHITHQEQKRAVTTAGKEGYTASE